MNENKKKKKPPNFLTQKLPKMQILGKEKASLYMRRDPLLNLSIQIKKLASW